jgi:branched-subunit amino acid ABC-type transport system permease component
MIAQLILNGTVSGLLLALPALALTLIFGILKFPNFAVGSMLTLGSYFAWICNSVFAIPLVVAGGIAALATALVALLSDALVFSRLRDRGAITLLVASMGISLILENICRFGFGNSTRSYMIDVARPIRWHGLRINHEQLVTAGVVIGCMMLVQLLLYYSPLGRAMRAVADNPSLAAVRGIERDTIVKITWCLFGCLTALSGVLAGMDRAVDPLLGWNYQVPIFAAAILGGLGSPIGAIFGALVIGWSEESSSLIVPTSYRQVVSFVVILGLLLVRTRGLFGERALRQ